MQLVAKIGSSCKASGHADMRGRRGKGLMQAVILLGQVKHRNLARYWQVKGNISRAVRVTKLGCAWTRDSRDIWVSHITSRFLKGYGGFGRFAWWVTESAEPRLFGVVLRRRRLSPGSKAETDIGRSVL